MATSFAVASSSPHVHLSTFHSKSHSPSPLCLPTTASLLSAPPTKKFIFFSHSPYLISPRPGPILAAPAEDVLPSEAVDATQQVVSNTDDGVSTLVSALLVVAFIGLSILTVGVIYLGVTDFLQKREKDKFEKEEAANKSSKKKKKKKVGRARAGPRGFGQKIDDEEDDD